MKTPASIVHVVVMSSVLPAFGQISIPPVYEVIRLTDAPVFHNWPHLSNNGRVVYSARVDGTVDEAGEVTWVSDLDPFTLVGAISYMRRFSLADVNCDGHVNAFDIEPFLLALFDPDGYRQAYPACDPLLADIDQNGSVDAFDIEPFIDLQFP